MIRKLVFIGFKYPHHSRYSGYDHIAEYLDYDLVLHANKLFFFRGFHAWANRFGDLKIGKYTLLQPLELFYRVFRVYTFWRTFFMKNTAIHFSYPETGLCFTGGFFRKTNRYVATIHLSNQVLDHIHPRIISRMKRMDHLITVGEDTPPFAGSTPVSFIPHGVDPDYFKSSGQHKKETDILMLGNWMRDFERAAKVFERILAKAPVKIKVIANKNNLDYFKNINGIECLHDIPDTALLRILQTTDTLFLPLSGLTANNALLEAAACGCRLCISLSKDAEVLYFRDYIKLLSPDVDGCAEELLAHLQNPPKDQNLRKFTLENYGWEIIAARTKEILRNTGV